MKRARSRLNKSQGADNHSSKATELRVPASSEKFTPSVRKKTGEKTDAKNATVSKYLNHSLMLVVAGINFYFLWHIFNNYYPRQIANFIIPGAYLPVIFLFFLGSFFLVSFILLNSKLGFFISTLLTIGFFLKLHGVLF